MLTEPGNVGSDLEYVYINARSCTSMVHELWMYRNLIPLLWSVKDKRLNFPGQLIGDSPLQHLKRQKYKSPAAMV